MARKLGLFSDFKAFINKGNVVDLAIAVVIAGAFGKVVGSVVTLITTNALEPALKPPMWTRSMPGLQAA